MFPCVWDASSSDKKDLNRRDAAWRTIADTFADAEENYTAKDCTAKWQSLRAIQRRILGEIKKKEIWVGWISGKTTMAFFPKHDVRSCDGKYTQNNFGEQFGKFNCSICDI